MSTSMKMDNTKVERIDRLEAYLKIRETGGKIFSVNVIKKDGSIRRMVARLRVSKPTTGKGLSFSPIQKRLMTVFDMQNREYRMVNLQTMFSLKIDGKQYSII